MSKPIVVIEGSTVPREKRTTYYVSLVGLLEAERTEIQEEIRLADEAGISRSMTVRDSALYVETIFKTDATPDLRARQCDLIQSAVNKARSQHGAVS